MADRRHLRRKRLSAMVTLEPGSLGAWGVRYLEDLAVRNYSPFTIGGEEKNLGRFIPWCEERDVRAPGEVTVPLLERYQRHLFHQAKADGKRLSFHTQYDRLGTVRRFLHWLTKQRVIAMNPAASLEPPRVERRLPKAILSAFEVEQILKTLDVTQPKGLRDRAILEVLYATGVRRHELAAHVLRAARTRLAPSERLDGLHRLVHLKLMEKYQEFSPFKFILYSAEIDQAVPAMALPAAR